MPCHALMHTRYGIFSAEHWVRFFLGVTPWKLVLWLLVHKHKTVVNVYWYLFTLIYWLSFSDAYMQGAFQTETSMFLVRYGRLMIVTNASVRWLQWFAAACKFTQIIVCLFRNWLKCSDLKSLAEICALEYRTCMSKIPLPVFQLALIRTKQNNLAISKISLGRNKMKHSKGLPSTQLFLIT